MTLCHGLMHLPHTLRVLRYGPPVLPPKRQRCSQAVPNSLHGCSRCSQGRPGSLKGAFQGACGLSYLATLEELLTMGGVGSTGAALRVP